MLPAPFVRRQVLQKIGYGRASCGGMVLGMPGRRNMAQLKAGMYVKGRQRKQVPGMMYALGKRRRVRRGAGWSDFTNFFKKTIPSAFSKNNFHKGLNFLRDTVNPALVGVSGMLANSGIPVVSTAAKIFNPIASKLVDMVPPGGGRRRRRVVRKRGGLGVTTRFLNSVTPIKYPAGAARRRKRVRKARK